MKKIKINKTLILISIIFLHIISSYGQDSQKDIKDYTREEVLGIPYEKLVDMPLEDLLILADIVGVSLDELYEMILNKDLVSASKTTESSFEAPLSTSVISYDEIVSSGARTLEEALRLIPGIIVREKTTGNFDVHIRGNDNLPPNQMFVYSENSITLVMINSRPVYNYVHGGTFWETLPVSVEDVERIEVVRGPSSALYGPNAVSGVINIITKEPDSRKLQVSGNAEYGSLNTLKSGLGFGQKISPKFGYRVTGNFFKADRTTDLLYAVRDGRMYTREGLDTATFFDQYGQYFLYDPGDNVYTMYPDPLSARNVAGGNAYLFYDHNSKIGTDVSMGYQHSDVITSTMGDNATTQTGRLSSTKYVDVRAQVYDLRAQFNMMNGWQDIIREDTGFKIDVMNLNANLEYDFKFDWISIRPGFSYQYAWYNDLEYLRKGQGFLNGNRDFNVTAGSIRLDAKPIKPLRLIAALRMEKYNTHNDMYLSYQFIASYNMNNRNLIRGVMSRANRSPFLVDQYADYFWDRNLRPIPRYIYFKGTPNLDLLTMDQYEIGFRSKPVKKIQVDVEAFYTKMTNFGGLYPDSVNINGGLPYVRMAFQNIELTSKQKGISASLSFLINKDFYVKAFATFQKTELFDAIMTKQDSIISTMLTAASFSGTGYYVGLSAKTADIENEATPTIYGGIILDYKALEQKLHTNINTYFMSKQSFRNKNVYFGDLDNPDDDASAYPLDAQININIKVSYEILKGIRVYVNARNLLSSNSEFAFIDEVKPTVLGGIQCNF